MGKPDYDTTLARMAGNIAASMAAVAVTATRPLTEQEMAEDAVSLARAIVAEIKRTEPDRVPHGEP